MRLYSSSDIMSSLRSFENRSLIRLSFLSANSSILSCFLALGIRLRLTKPPIIKSKPAPSDTASIAVTAGAATTVDRNTTLMVFNPIKETARTPSAALTTFKLLCSLCLISLVLLFRVLVVFAYQRYFEDDSHCPTKE